MLVFVCVANYRDEFDNSDDEGSISLDEDNDSDGSDIFESDSDEEENESDPDVSDPEDEQPKKKRMKSVSSKAFQKKLKHTSSKFGIIALFLWVSIFTRSSLCMSVSFSFKISTRYELTVCGR